MKLSDIVGAATGLAIYAEIALVLFLAAFVAVFVQVVSKARRADWDEAESLPLSDGDAHEGLVRKEHPGEYRE